MVLPIKHFDVSANKCALVMKILYLSLDERQVQDS